MPGRIEKTVFISYRRSNFYTALAVYQDLTAHGYDVFFDFQSIDSGDFEKAITENIKAKAHFLIILSPSALERCNEPDDWLRREIEMAIDERRNIVPLMMEGFEFGGPSVKEALSGKLSILKRYNGMRLVADYFFEAMEKLRGRYLNVALQDIYLHPLNPKAQEITEANKTSSNGAESVDAAQLTAEEWFERGFVLGLDDDTDEAIKCFSEAIGLNPSYEAYFNRGIIRREIGDLEGAIQDYDLAIRINPSESEIYNNRGNARRDKGDLPGAMSDYDAAIRLNPNAARVFINRGIVYKIRGDLDSALADFTKAISLKPSDLDMAEASYSRGVVFQLKDELEKAVADYRLAITISTASYHVMAGIALMNVLRKTGDYVEADEQETIARNLIARENEYNRSCFEAAYGNVDKALELLNIGLEKKQATRAWARLDPDLETIRNDPRFDKIVGE
jgi:tetratricopeptide (TPR) repeat protein